METTHHAQAEGSEDPNAALLALFDMLPPAGSESLPKNRDECLRFASVIFNRLCKEKGE